MGSSLQLRSTVFEGERTVISGCCAVLAWKLQHLSEPSLCRGGRVGSEWAQHHGWRSWAGVACPDAEAVRLYTHARRNAVFLRSSNERSCPYCCVLDLGGISKCPASYLNSDKPGTSTLGNKFLCLIQPLWGISLIIFFSPLSLFFFFFFLNSKK